MKIKQIAVTSGGEENRVDIVYALTDGGTVLRMVVDITASPVWIPLPITTSNGAQLDSDDYRDLVND